MGETFHKFIHYIINGLSGHYFLRSYYDVYKAFNKGDEEQETVPYLSAVLLVHKPDMQCLLDASDYESDEVVVGGEFLILEYGVEYLVDHSFALSYHYRIEGVALKADLLILQIPVAYVFYSFRKFFSKGGTLAEVEADALRCLGVDAVCHGQDEIFLALEMPVYCATGHIGGLGYLLHGGVVVSLFCKDSDSRIKNHLLGLLCIFLCPSHQILKFTNKQFVCKSTILSCSFLVNTFLYNCG